MIKNNYTFIINYLYEIAFGVNESGQNNPVKQAFTKWVTTKKGAEGAYAHVFNSPHDSLSSLLGSNFMLGINMNEALDDPLLGPPVVTHISQAISIGASKNSKGFAIFIDEAAKLLQNEGFKLTAKEMFREYRKQNGIVGMAFQDPSALAKSGIGETALDNTSTFFFFPNPQGRASDYELFNLREEELSFILGGDGMAGRRVLNLKTDAARNFRESVILDIDLAPLGKAVRFYRSGIDAVKNLESAKLAFREDFLNGI